MQLKQNEPREKKRISPKKEKVRIAGVHASASIPKNKKTLEWSKSLVSWNHSVVAVVVLLRANNEPVEHEPHKSANVSRVSEIFYHDWIIDLISKAPPSIFANVAKVVSPRREAGNRK